MTARRLIAFPLLFLTFGLAAADFQIVNMDDPGVGLNDPTPVDPVGGNNGTTLGEQRLRVLERVGEIWGELLESNLTIRVEAETVFFNCGQNGTTLATAGTTFIYRFGGSPLPSTWYNSALADALSGTDRNPNANDISTRFNLGLDEDPQCSGFNGWYYGLDFNNGDQTDLLATMLHEFAHGLGFANFVDESNGSLPNGFPDTYTTHTFDVEAGKGWNDMTDAERVASAINDPDVVWNGPNVTANQATYLDAAYNIVVDGIGLQENIDTLPANFGTMYDQTITGDIILADDGTDNPTEGCEASTISLQDRIVLIDRGSCDFSTKALNAQNAGARAVIVANNQDTPIFNMGVGVVGGEVTIPAAMISMADGQRIKDNLVGGLSATMGVNPAVRSGTRAGFVRLNAEDPLNPGSSISHWTRATSPNLLMEPSINDDLSGVDLTVYQMRDIGWTVNLATDDAVDRLVYPWLSFNNQFDTVFVLNNQGSTDALVQLTGRRFTDDPFTVEVNVPAAGFVELPIDQVFPTLSDGSGFSVVAASDNDRLAGRWVTRGLQSPSADSPSQGVAVDLNDSGRVGEAVLFGYLPNDDITISAPVIVNTGAAATDVTLYFYNADGTLIETDTTSVVALEPYRPFAAPVSTLVAPGQTVSMVAHAPGQTITGVVFVFNQSFLEPAIGNAQVIDFSAP